jgi:hypothetical protein
VSDLRKNILRLTDDELALVRTAVVLGAGGSKPSAIRERIIDECITAGIAGDARVASVLGQAPGTTAETAEPLSQNFVHHHYHYSAINAEIAEENRRLMERMARVQFER